MFAHSGRRFHGTTDGGKRDAPVDSRSVDTRSSGRRPARHPLALPVRLRVLPLLAGALLALAAVGPVLGHAELVSSDPADKAVLDTPPTVITLTFDEGVVGKSSFKLIGPGGDTIGTGGPAKDGDVTMTLDGLALAPGAYTIEWTSVADDGDVERGTLTFTVNEPTPAPATPTPAPSQASTAPSAEPLPHPVGDARAVAVRGPGAGVDVVGHRRAVPDHPGAGPRRRHRRPPSPPQPRRLTMTSRVVAASPRAAGTPVACARPRPPRARVRWWRSPSCSGCPRSRPPTACHRSTRARCRSPSTSSARRRRSPCRSCSCSRATSGRPPSTRAASSTSRP